ncbi:MAG: hypothetical protein WKG32_08325 [Gemmatimonadaceae bacterium]
MPNTPATDISLTDAAFRLRARYQRALDMVLRGELEGKKRAGRWYVTEASVERARAARDRADAEPPRAA